MLPKHPFKGISQLPEQGGNNLAYSDHERSVIINYLKENDIRMYYAVSFLFHAFIRKTELSTIRVGDIDFANKTIRINSGAAKNRKQESVTITEGLLQVINDMELDKFTPGHYIFGHQMETSERKIGKADLISDRYLAVKKKLGFVAGDGKTFYAWKHTGVVAYWNALKDPYAIMRQCRHSDLKTTLVYLKSLGLNPNFQFRDANVVL
jgi:integrase